MKKLKVCFISLGVYPLFNTEVDVTFGGAEVQLYTLSKALNSLNKFDVSFIVGDFGQADVEEYDGIELYKSIKVEKSTNRFYRPFIKLFLLFKSLKKVDCDIYIARTASISWLVVFLFLKLLRKKFVYWVANDGELDGSHLEYKKTLFKLSFKLLLAGSDAVVVQNQYQKDMLLKNFSVNGVIFPSVIDLEESDEVDPACKKGVLWVGRCDKHYKQPELFLRLAKMSPNLNFVMIAPPASCQNQFFHEIKAKASAIDNLKFIDFVPYCEVDRYFRNAKLFVNTSQSEGFPNTFIQAAKNKTPIVSLSVNPNDILDPVENNHPKNSVNAIGYVCANNVDRVHAGINKLLNNHALYSEYSNRSFKYVKDKHNVHKNIQMLVSLIDNICPPPLT